MVGRSQTQLAAEDVKQAFKREAGEKRHVYLSVASFQRKAQAHVAAAKKPDMTARMEKMDYKHRGMVRFYRKHFRHQYPAGLMGLVVVGVWTRFAAVALQTTLRHAPDELVRPADAAHGGVPLTSPSASTGAWRRPPPMTTGSPFSSG